MKRNSKLLAKFGGLGMATILRALRGTLDYKIAHDDLTTDPARREFVGRYIYVFWHEYITFPVMLWGHCNVAALVSLHRDGEWITRAAYHLGFDIVRGSTSRRGAAAIRELRRFGRQGNLTIMPDGPKGPRRKMSVGPVYLASRLGLPLVPIGFGYDRPWRMATWDRFAVPHPFSRGRAIFGPPLQIPRDLDREGMEQHRPQAEVLLNELTEEAELWAASRSRRANQCSAVRQPKLRGALRFGSCVTNAHRGEVSRFKLRSHQRWSPSIRRRPTAA